jgi:Fic family protein
MHRRLLAGVRGRERTPGKFRTTQNWVGESGSTVETARFVPPPAAELPALLADWERCAHETVEVPLLVQNAMLHYQFETLHPFLDGNGRIGRLLSVFLLVEHGRLPAPLLYLSAYLERDRARYYEALQAVRQSGDAIPWIELFLAAVGTQAADAVVRSQRIVELRERYRTAASAITSNKAITLVDLVCETPIISSHAVEASLGVTRPTALKLLRQLEDVGVLEQGNAGPRGQRRYLARELMVAVTDEEPALPGKGPRRTPSRKRRRAPL